MTDKVICDTGIISRYLEEKKDIVFVIDEKIGSENIVITPLNRIELLNWLSGYNNLDKPKRTKFLRFIKALPIIHINEKTSKLAIDLSNNHINSKPADTFIAAIAFIIKLHFFLLIQKILLP